MDRPQSSEQGASVRDAVTIAVDAMGGDAGPSVCVPAAVGMVRQHPSLRLVLTGLPEVLEPALAQAGDCRDRLTIRPASQVVDMDEPPADALRKKKDSSLRLAIDLVRSGEADAAISAGNTGALMATGRFVLKTLPGIDRPAIMARMPTRHGAVYMLDLGANADCTSEHLFQFAVMGAVVARVTGNNANPRIGLLNIGEEEIKGNDTVRQAAALLAASHLNYIGFIEGDVIHEHRADVIVCDGFSGNVALKTMEGTARLIRHFLRAEFSGSVYGRLAGLVAAPVLRSLAIKLDPRQYNGASLVGLNGIVIKSHGSADEVAFRRALTIAMLEAQMGVPQLIRDLLEEQAR
ncbi:MAG: phosphate acyltransferase PlsX [Chromatiales bacterium]|nr:phosphate acyltransferase PlsX [Chromatiales bacterium]